MKKKNVYDLALIKVQQEQTTLELLLKEKNNKKRELEKILEREEEIKEMIRGQMEVEKTISPSFIHLNRQIDHTEKQRIFSLISRIESEVLTLKREYLRIKTRKEKIVEQKEIKENELEKMKTKKEIKQIQNDYIAKSFLNKEGGKFED
ncbi:hypothetical protein MZM54_01270 [[Brevibacterium] frigoritolerans]|nr:hypothetical protein [Peribacillus frigoritolerans]